MSDLSAKTECRLATGDPALRCLLCGSRGTIVVERDEAYCCSCNVRFPSSNSVPILARNYSALAEQIEGARRNNPAWYEVAQPAEDASPWRHHLKKRRSYVESILARELSRRGRQRAARLLDIGCGDGNHLAWLAAFADQVYGSDYNMLRLVRARDRLPNARLFLGDILDFPAADEAFDVVFFNHVIEHIADDVSALATVNRIVSPGGILILGTPNEGAWWWQLAYRRAPAVRATTDHVHFYTAETIGRKVRAAGFEIVEIEHLGWGPPDWNLDGRIRKYKFFDDAFEWLGRRLIPHQASSLYIIAAKH